MTIVARVAALVVAVGLVLGGFALRGGDDGDPLVGPVDEPRTLVCSTDLGALCRSLAAGVEGLTVETDRADRLATSFAAPDATGVWLAPRTWASVVAFDRDRAGLPPAVVAEETLASSPLVLVGWEERLAVLADTCGVDLDGLGWDCVGQHAGAEWASLGGSAAWGRVRPGHAAPSTGLGLGDTAAVVAGRTGTGFALQDLRDPATSAWFSGLEGAVQDHTPAQGRHLTAMVVLGPSAADVAVATAGEVDVAAASSFGRLVSVEAQPRVVVELTLVGPDADGVADLVELLSDPAVEAAFSAAGWDPGAPVTEQDPVASGGALVALRTAWAEAVG